VASKKEKSGVKKGKKWRQNYFLHLFSCFDERFDARFEAHFDARFDATFFKSGKKGSKNETFLILPTNKYGCASLRDKSTACGFS
jgi:hypothetical protein